MMRLIVLLTLLIPLSAFSQKKQKFSRQDSLRGSITAERAWWDINFYDLQMQVFPQEKKISGINTISYTVLSENQKMQIDLQTPMELTSAVQDGQELSMTREGNVYFIEIQKTQEIGSQETISLHYSGIPIVSKNPPWDGGLVWTKDDQGTDWITTAVQGAGASLWWPCKDHYYDEPDSMLVTTRFPGHLMNVGNGRLRKVEMHEDSTKSTQWFVSNPINNYGININIGDYVHFGEKFQGEQGELDCDYYVLSYNLDKAKKQFKQVGPMMEAFEHWFGPYPFYEDSYKLVEVPYPGMEHQSSVTYGNGYKNGYRGRDVSNTGWGYRFDFILIHESGHEWFANSITHKDVADMWIHEGFTAYSESLYLDFLYGKKGASEYAIGTRQNIRNDKPIIGNYDVNNEGSSDMYSKAANMLHTLRYMINDDEKWRSILRGINKDYFHSVVSSAEIEKYLEDHSGLKLKKYFDQYLRTTDIPIFEYNVVNKKLKYRFKKAVDGFKIPILVKVGTQDVWLEACEDWQTYQSDYSISKIEVDENWYVEVEDMNVRAEPRKRKKG